MMGIACRTDGLTLDDHPSSTATASAGSSSNSSSGTVYVTDMDQIEKSNLSRQFLFRNSDIGQPKSTTAGRQCSQVFLTYHPLSQFY